MTYVAPDGPVPCEFAVVGSAPGAEEVKAGRGFVGPSGALLWPLMRRLAMLDRSECYVTNLRKEPFEGFDDPEEMEAEEFARCVEELREEFARVRPRRVLAVGALAARALLGDRYLGMDVCNGMGFELDARWENAVAVPTWHPAASLRPGGEDRLAYTGAAIAALREPRVVPIVPPHMPGPMVADFMVSGPDAEPTLGIDTEGTPDDPICMTVATRANRWYVEPRHVPEFFDALPTDVELRFHNALWDWPVLWAMGAPRDIATRWRWRDTMELAYLRQTEPRGLKALAYRHLGLHMRSYEEVVRPYWEEMVKAVAAGRVAAGTTVVTHSAKTGKLLKKPKLIVDDAVKPLKRALGNPELLAKRMPGLPGMTLRLVPEAERVEYATMDAWATVMLEEHLA